MGLKQEVERGKQQLMYIEENVEDYEIEIESVDISNSNHSKGW